VMDHFQSFLFSMIVHPDLIQQSLTVALKQAQSDLSLCKKETDQYKQRYGIIKVTCDLQLAIGRPIVHPFVDGHRRLVRIIMATILLQNGIPYIRCDPQYTTKLQESARFKDTNILLNYTRQLFSNQHPTLDNCQQ